MYYTELAVFNDRAAALIDLMACLSYFLCKPLFTTERFFRSSFPPEHVSDGTQRDEAASDKQEVQDDEKKRNAKYQLVHYQMSPIEKELADCGSYRYPSR